MAGRVTHEEKIHLSGLLDQHKESFERGPRGKIKGLSRARKDFFEAYGHHEGEVTNKMFSAICLRIVTGHSVIAGDYDAKWDAFMQHGKASLKKPYGTAKMDTIRSRNPRKGLNEQIGSQPGNVSTPDERGPQKERSQNGHPDTLTCSSRGMDPRYREPSSSELSIRVELPTTPQARVSHINQQVQESPQTCNQEREPLGDGEVAGRMRELNLLILNVAKRFASKQPRRKHGLDGTSLLAYALSLDLSREGLQGHETLISVRVMISGAVCKWVLSTSLVELDFSVELLKKAILSEVHDDVDADGLARRVYDTLRFLRLHDSDFQQNQLPLQAARLTEKLQSALDRLFEFLIYNDDANLAQGDRESDATFLSAMQDMFLTALRLRLDLSLKRRVPTVSYPLPGERFDVERMASLNSNSIDLPRMGVQHALLPVITVFRRREDTENQVPEEVVLCKALVLVGRHTNSIA